MDNADRLELRRQRMAAAPPILRGGFRPFFLGAGLWAVFAITIWLWVLETGAIRPGAFDPLIWHRHEMLFGFVGAAIAGFILTAVPNWTGRLPIAGGPLAALALWWLTARLLPLALPDLPLAILAIIDGGFYLALAFLILREIMQSKNRNLPVTVVIGLFGVADMLDYAGTTGAVSSGLGANAGIALAITLISIIGGRIVPSFTRNWMQRQQMYGALPTQPNRFDLLVIVITVVALIAWLIAGPSNLAGMLLVIAGAAQLIRLLRWQGWRSISAPIVFILHVAYGWITIGLLLLGAEGLGQPVSASAGVHALTIGAMASMILAVMTRATLGHTGHALHADLTTKVCYISIQLAAITRTFASLSSEYYLPLLRISGLAWILAFGLFLFAYGPKLLRGRRVRQG